MRIIYVTIRIVNKNGENMTINNITFTTLHVKTMRNVGVVSNQDMLTIFCGICEPTEKEYINLEKFILNVK